MFAIALFLCLTSCSNETKLELLFPLGISVEEVMKDEIINSKACPAMFMSEEEVKKELTKNYEIEEGKSYGGIHKEDNFKTKEDLNGVTCLALKKYIKDGIQYDKMFLFFKKDKLFQVYADTRGEDNISFIKMKLASFPEYKEVTFEKTYVSDNTNITFEALQYKSGKVFFEIQKEKDTRTYYTYYTEKVLPLFGVDY